MSLKATGRLWRPLLLPSGSVSSSAKGEGWTTECLQRPSQHHTSIILLVPSVKPQRSPTSLGTEHGAVLIGSPPENTQEVRAGHVLHTQV